MKKSIIITGMIFFVLTGCVKNRTPDQILELNRHGKWQEAVKASLKIIADRADFPFGQVCQTYHSLIYAETRLKHTDTAREHYQNFMQYKKNRPVPSYLLWMDREMESLQLELGITDNQEAPTPRDDSWETAAPGSLGLNVQALEGYIDLCRLTGADACLVVYNSRIAAEWYKAVPGQVLSGPGLSLTGILIGMLIDQGRIKSIDEPAGNYIASWNKGDKKKITLRHLLTMTSGLEAGQKRNALVNTGDKNRYVKGLGPVNEPGTTWAYSAAGVQLLSPVMDKAAGMPIQDYTRKYLFEPLEMNSTWFNEDVAGHALTYAALFSTPRDLAKIGLLVINNGSYRRKQIVSPEWITKMISPSQDLNPAFGLLWSKLVMPPGYGDMGFYNSHLAVYPDKKLIVVRMQSSPDKSNQDIDYQRQASQLIAAFID